MLSQPTAARVANSVTQSSAAKASGSTKGDVLVVDDDESVLLTLQAVLQMDGYDVEACSQGSDAIQLLRERTFDLVLSDLRLDDMDGTAILAEIRRRSPDTVAIMLTGYASLETAVKALREGAYDYLVKPCDVEELKATVARGIERRQLTVELKRRMGELEEANQTIRDLNQGLQRRVEVATVTLRERLSELQRANTEIAALHKTAEEHVVKLTELDQLKSQFLSMASHELKTPLTVISGFLQVALRRKQRRLARGFPEEQEWLEEQKSDSGQLEVLNTQATKLGRLVDELLEPVRDSADPEGRDGTGEFEAGKGHQVEASEDIGAALVVAHEATEAGLPGKRPLDDPPSGEQDEAPLSLGGLDDLQADAVLRRVVLWHRAGVALVHPRHFHGVAGRFLDCRGERGDLGAVLVVGGGGSECQHVAQRVHCEVDFAALLSLGAVVPGPRATLRRTLKGLAVQDGRRGQRSPPLRQPQQCPQIVQ